MQFKALARGIVVLLFGVAFALPAILAVPQKSASQLRRDANPQATAIATYPESGEGLKSLLQDWFAAIKAGDAAKSSQYLESLAIPNHQEWLVNTFGAEEGARLEDRYSKSQAKSLEALAVRAQQAVQAEKLSVKTRLFDKSACGQPPELVALSATMVHPATIYRAFNRKGANDSSPAFLGNFVYVHGGFRYFDQQEMQAASATPPMRVALAESALSETACGGPFYPLYAKEAREKRIQGTVVLHVIVTTDGTLRDIKAVSGDPLLIPAAIDAVKQWRYKPTLKDGRPVEVETQINVIFKIQQSPPAEGSKLDDPADKEHIPQ